MKTLSKVEEQIQSLRDQGYEVDIDYVPELDEQIADIKLCGESIAAGRVNLRTGLLELISLQDGAEALQLFEKMKGV